jgi:hypothetical protein
MNYIFLLLVFSLQAHASDAITDLCKHDVRQQTATRAQQKVPTMSTQKINAAIDGETPAAEYVVQADTAVCIADKIKLALDKPSNFDNYCFMAQAKTRVECFQAWQKKQDIAYAKQVVQLAQTAYELAKKDLGSGGPQVDAGKVAAAAIDAYLTQLEKYSIVKNVAFKPGGGVERKKLQEQERADFKKAHAAVLKMAEEEWVSLSALTQVVAKKQKADLKAANTQLASLKARIKTQRAVR